MLREVACLGKFNVVPMRLVRRIQNKLESLACHGMAFNACSLLIAWPLVLQRAST